MRIDGNGRVVGPRQGGAAGKSGSEGRFSLALGETPAEAAAVRSAPAVTSLDAMLALQGAEDPTERRRRQVKRGRRLLDALDQLKLSVLDDHDASDVLSQLAEAARAGREIADDPGLESVLAEIDLRVAVELAKRERVGR